MCASLSTDGYTSFLYNNYGNWIWYNKSFFTRCIKLLINFGYHNNYILFVSSYFYYRTKLWGNDFHFGLWSISLAARWITSAPPSSDWIHQTWWMSDECRDARKWPPWRTLNKCIPPSPGENIPDVRKRILHFKRAETYPSPEEPVFNSRQADSCLMWVYTAN